jgi:DNA-binding transcriptional ArsR family regulator
MDKGQPKDNKVTKTHDSGSRISDFVLDKFIFSNVFEKDIRRIYIYRKTERLAKAIQLITPAFGNAPALRNRLDGVAVGLIDAAIAPPVQSKEALSRELLALSSILSVARTGGLLSDMNADLIAREAHLLLQEIASYEEPRLFLEDAPTLAELAKQAPDLREPAHKAVEIFAPNLRAPATSSKGHLKDKPVSDKGQNDRKEAILSILRSKGPSTIKNISTVIRDISEKTIQRELQNLVSKGSLERSGERRWTLYSIPSI